MRRDQGQATGSRHFDNCGISITGQTIAGDHRFTQRACYNHLYTPAPRCINHGGNGAFTAISHGQLHVLCVRKHLTKSGFDLCRHFKGGEVFFV